MDKIAIAARTPAGYLRQTINAILVLIENAVNRAADGYLFPVKRVTANYTMSLNDGVILVDCTSGAVTVTLKPAKEWEQKRIAIKKIDSSANAVTIDGNGSETIDGSTTLSIPTQYISYDLVSQGGSVFIV